MKRKIQILFALLLFVSQLSIGQSNLYELIKASPEHRILSILIDLSGSAEDLQNPPVPLTVFAPTDAAFESLGPYKLIQILSNPEVEIEKLLGRHIVIGKFDASNIYDGQQMLTSTSEILTVGLVGGVFSINGVEVVNAHIPASNGTLNVINEFIEPISTGNTVADVIINSPIHQGLSTILAANGLETQLRGEGPFTVFAPSDAAMLALDPLFLQELYADQSGKLASLLLYHITLGVYTSSSLSNNQEILMANGQRLTITFDGDVMKVNDIPVTIKDIPADNGVVHSIDVILVPDLEETNTILDIIARSPDHHILFATIALNELDADLRSEGPITVFAPTDAAFEALPPGFIQDVLLEGTSSEILLSHVLGGSVTSSLFVDDATFTTINGTPLNIRIEGEDIYINNAKIIVKDIVADNGIVHVIDAVLIPEIENTIYDVILKSPDHRILQGLINLLGGKEDLSTPGIGLTLFAPTDEAFTKLPQEIIDTILNSELEELATIIGYHVAPELLPSSALTDGLGFFSITDAALRVYKIGDDTYINNARIIQTDIIASNGIVHVLDDVILAPDVVGLKVLSQKEGVIFPNPARDQMNFDFRDVMHSDMTLEILDATGKLLEKMNVGNEGLIPLSRLTTGVYQLRALDGTSVLTKPFIVVK